MLFTCNCWNPSPIFTSLPIKIMSYPETPSQLPLFSLPQPSPVELFHITSLCYSTASTLLITMSSSTNLAFPTALPSSFFLSQSAALLILSVSELSLACCLLLSLFILQSALIDCLILSK
jgi:hypothetical protein